MATLADKVACIKKELGLPATLTIAEAIDADVIVMATHNRGALARFFVGSVANFCLRNATMPVVLLRPGEYALDRKRSHHRVLIDRHD